MSREEVRYMGECFAKALEDLGLCPRLEADGKKFRTLGVLIHNCWMGPVLMYAGLYMPFAGNFIYTEPPDHFYYNVNHGLFDTLVLSNSMFDVYFKALERKDIRVVRNLIVEDNAPAEALEKFKSYGITIYYFSEVAEKGKSSTAKLERCTPETHTLVVSTSGSTGSPKGAVLHDTAAYMNVVIECGPWEDCFGGNDEYMLNNITLGFGSILGFNYSMLGRGGKLVYVEKKCANFFEELKLGNPTFTIISPLAYNKMYQGIQDVINKLPEEKKQGILKVLDMKMKYYKDTNKYAHPEFDKLLEPFKKNFFGDRLKLMINVGAAMNDEVLTFFRIFTGQKMINVYGSTEMGGLCNVGGDTDSAELVGMPAPAYEMKLVDVPEKNYFTTDKPYPRGELYVRGPSMDRYLNEPDKTAETITPDGWLKTGDIAVLRDGFSIQLIDRKNQVIKLTCAEYLSVEHAENLYKNSQYVAQICVYADNTKDYAIGIVVPNMARLMEVAKEKGLTTADPEEICRNKEMEEVVVEDFKKIGDAKEVLYFEYLPKVVLVTEPFTQANGLVTATYKVRRPQVAKKYADRIDAAYKEKNVRWIH